MALFENFPYTNLQDLNLGWIINQLKKVESGAVISVNGQTGEVTLYESPSTEFPEVDSNTWQLIRTCNDVICGIHFNKNGTATIVNGNRLVQIYTEDNPPAYPVTSVNGQTGDITLYQSSQVRLPDLTDEELTNWNIFRRLNGSAEGIQFSDDGTVYIIHGANRWPIYSFNNPPAYPVTSVDGATGAVVLYPDEDIQFNDLDLPNVHAIRLFSMLNSNMLGIKLTDNGLAYLVRGNDEYPLYIQGLNNPSDFSDPTAAVLELVNNLSTGTQWGIVRDIGNDTLGIVIAWDNAAADYKVYFKNNNQLTQLLSLHDIPSQSGVISINNETGVVTLTGEDISINTQDPTSIESAFEMLKSSVAITENTDEATHAIVKGEFVIWKNRMYQATANITIGDTLDNTNLSAISKGGLNVLEDTVDYSGLVTWGAANVTGNSPVCVLMGLGRIRMLRVVFHPTTNTLQGYQTILNIPAGHRPLSYISELVGDAATNPTVRLARLTTDGDLQVYSPNGITTSINMMYLADI